MKDFTWKIASVDQASGHMVVDYTLEGDTQSLNVPIPPATEDRDKWVAMYAPSLHWSRKGADLHAIDAGVEGSGQFEDAAAQSSGSETPNVVGSWNEEYLRAMIYQVMEEIRESEV